MSRKKFTRGEGGARQPKQRPFGLPPLSLSDAAGLLDIEVGALELWIMKHPRFKPSQRSMWLRKNRTLSPEVLELYLRERGDSGVGKGAGRVSILPAGLASVARARHAGRDATKP